MKIIKTKINSKLGQERFTVAMRFDSWQEASDSKIESWCRNQFGSEWASTPHWRGHFGTAKYLHGDYSRPYFVGFRDMATLTTALMALGLTYENIQKSLCEF